MRVPTLVITLLMFSVSLYAQKKEYVCTPCGLECDKEIHTAGGSCGSCGMDLVEKSTLNFSDLTIDQLCARLAANPKAVLLDVRTTAEFRGTSQEVPSVGHFKNAINVNVEELASRVDELTKYKDNEVLVYCSHSHRSPRASYYLSTHGFKNVKNFAGGVSTLAGQEGNDCLKKNFVFHK